MAKGCWRYARPRTRRRGESPVGDCKGRDASSPEGLGFSLRRSFSSILFARPSREPPRPLQRFAFSPRPRTRTLASASCNFASQSSSRGALRLLRSSRYALTQPDRYAAGASRSSGNPTPSYPPAEGCSRSGCTSRGARANLARHESLGSSLALHSLHQERNGLDSRNGEQGTVEEWRRGIAFVCREGGVSCPDMAAGRRAGRGEPPQAEAHASRPVGGLTRTNRGTRSPPWRDFVVARSAKPTAPPRETLSLLERVEGDYRAILLTVVKVFREDSVAPKPLCGSDNLRVIESSIRSY